MKGKGRTAMNGKAVIDNSLYTGLKKQTRDERRKGNHLLTNWVPLDFQDVTQSKEKTPDSQKDAKAERIPSRLSSLPPHFSIISSPASLELHPATLRHRSFLYTQLSLIAVVRGNSGLFLRGRSERPRIVALVLLMVRFGL